MFNFVHIDLKNESKQRICLKEFKDQVNNMCQDLEEHPDLLSERGIGHSDREDHADHTPSDNAQVDTEHLSSDVRTRSLNFSKLGDAQPTISTLGDHHSNTGEASGEFQSQDYARSVVCTLEEPISLPTSDATVSMRSSSNKNNSKMRRLWADIDNDDDEEVVTPTWA